MQPMKATAPRICIKTRAMEVSECDLSDESSDFEIIKGFTSSSLGFEPTCLRLIASTDAAGGGVVVGDGGDDMFCKMNTRRLEM